jgi:Rhomboid-like protein
MAAWIRTAPATYLYLLTLTVTTAVLETASEPAAHRLLLEQSTNLDRLEDDPVRVLVSSAFWLGHPVHLVGWTIAFTLILAPAERLLGTGRWIATFATGHLGATGIAAVVLWLGIHGQLLDDRLAHMQDVGASYGFLAVAGALTFSLHGRLRLAYAAVLWIAVAVDALAVEQIGAVGHAAALLLGYGCWALYGRPASGRRIWPSASSAATPARGSPSRLW